MGSGLGEASTQGLAESAGGAGDDDVFALKAASTHGVDSPGPGWGALRWDQ